MIGGENVCMYVCNAFKDTRFNDSQQMFTKMINK